MASSPRINGYEQVFARITGEGNPAAAS